MARSDKGTLHAQLQGPVAADQRQWELAQVPQQNQWAIAL
jgi:hypothetical protein